MSGRARSSGQDQEQAGDTPQTKPDTTRITVNIGPDTERALRMVMENERVTLTEAVRRLIGYGELIYRAIKIDGKDILIRQDGETQQIILV